MKINLEPAKIKTGSVLPTGLADMGNVLGLVTRSVGNRDEIDAEAVVDQKPHAPLTDANFRRE